MTLARPKAVDVKFDIEGLDGRLEAAMAGGLLSSGLARRIGLAARLAQAAAAADPGSGALSGEALSHILGLSRAAVHKHVRHLRALGFAVTSVPGAGYRLERPFTDLVAAEAVLPFMLGRPWQEGGWRAGLPYLYAPSCGSTNLALKQVMAEAGEPGGEPGLGVAAGPRAGSRQPAAAPPTGAVVVTDEQTGGRGRQGRSWSSEPGKDLTFSVLIRPSVYPAQAHLLSLAAAVAVAETLETLAGLEGPVGVKWPNDLLLGEEKVCGILIEGSMDAECLHWAVAGIGLNVNSAASILVESALADQAMEWAGKPRPVSLRERLDREVPRAPLLAALLDRLTTRWSSLERGPDSRVQAEPLQSGGLRAGRLQAGPLQAGQATPPPAGAGARWAAGPSAMREGRGGSGVEELLAELRRRDILVGRAIEVLSGTGRREVVAAGEAAGIGSEGQLLVRRAAGDIVEVFAGDVTLCTGL